MFNNSPVPNETSNSRRSLLHKKIRKSPDGLTQSITKWTEIKRKRKEANLLKEQILKESNGLFFGSKKAKQIYIDKVFIERMKHQNAQKLI